MNREIQVLTCVEDEVTSRTKQFWVPITMSGQVSALVESTQLLWQLTRNPEQVRSPLFLEAKLLLHPVTK